MAAHAETTTIHGGPSQNAMKSPPILRRLQGRLRRISDVVPPTWRGFLLAAISGIALWLLAFGHLDLVLYVIGITGILLLVLCSVTTAATALWLRRRLPDGAGVVRRIESGSPIRTGWKVPALRWVPLIKVSWQWLTIDGVEVRVKPVGDVLREEIVARRRGWASQLKRRVTVEDVFGLTRLAWVHVDPSEVTVLPDRGQLRDMPVIQSKTAAEGIPHPSGAPEGDRMDIRRYAPGDSVRNILWKTYARTRQLNVRIPELSIERSKKTIAYLLGGPDDEAAAAAARVALEAGALGENWVFGADGTEGSTESLEPALTAIARSGSFAAEQARSAEEESPRSGLVRYLREVGNQGEVHCIVFAPSSAGAWTEDVLEAARHYPGVMTFVVGTDGVWRAQPRAWWQKFLFVEPERRGISLDQLGALLRRLGAARCPSLVIDRASGRSFNQAQQQALGASA